MFKLDQLKPRPNSRFRRKRVARGESSGMGKTAGRGSKGQQSRSGGGFYVGFEGGQNPLYKRVPKLKGFKNHFSVEFAVVNLDELNELKETMITPDVLKQNGLVRKNAELVKVLGNGEFKHKATIKAHAFSASAEEKIKKAGGSIEKLPLLPKTKASKVAKKASPNATVHA